MEAAKTVTRRWFMLILFCIISMTNAFQWLQYSIISDVLVKYYDVRSMGIDWTSMIYMLTYIPFIMPASWLLDKYGLRWTLIAGSLGNCLGPWIKCGSASPDRFYVTFIGQTVSALAQIFVLGVPPRLAAIWFGPSEVSTATSLGVFGNQVGVAIGFLVPPMIVKGIQVEDNSTNFTSTYFTDTVTYQLQIVYFGTAAVTTVVFVLILLFFTDKPKVPPSLAQMAAIEEALDRNFSQTLKKLLLNFNFILLVISYGINVGVFYALSTFLNQILLPLFPGEGENIGRIGLTLVFGGILGSLVCGIWLDRTKRYKSTVCVVYTLSLALIIVFTFTIGLSQIWIVFVVAAFVGFFTTGYLPLGFEYACEITYPLPEGTSSGLLNASAQMFGIIITLVIGKVLDFSVLYANLTMVSALAVGTLITFFIKAHLNRHEAELQRASESKATLATISSTESTFSNLAYINNAFDDFKEKDEKFVTNITVPNELQLISLKL